MSRIGKRPVALPSGVTATVEGGTLSVKGSQLTPRSGLRSTRQGISPTSKMPKKTPGSAVEITSWTGANGDTVSQCSPQSAERRSALLSRA